jgi:DNA primase catalytic subunit
MHTVINLNPKDDDSHHELLVCMGLLDTFSCEYFKQYGGKDSGEEITRITKTIWEMEKSLSYGRKGNSKNRIKCVNSMTEIMNRVKSLSKEQSAKSSEKLSGKLTSLISARDAATQARKTLLTKFSFPKLSYFVNKYKSESLDAELKLVNKIKESQASLSVNSKDEMISKNDNQLPLINLFNKKSFFANFFEVFFVSSKVCN